MGLIIEPTSRIMKFGFIIIILSVLLSCANENLKTNQEALKGKWVDVNTKTDTLTFVISENDKYLIVSRGKEMRDGFLLPKYGSGPYYFNLVSDNKISLNSRLSSNSNFTDYYFDQVGEILKLSDFFNGPTTNILTFKKIN